MTMYECSLCGARHSLPECSTPVPSHLAELDTCLTILEHEIRELEALAKLLKDLRKRA